MPTNLTWGSYLYRTPSGLRCGTLADVPKCATCGGPGKRWCDGHPAWQCDETCLCPDCHGTGLAWHWECKPTAGMLCKRKGEWFVDDKPDPFSDAGNIYSSMGIAPLLPPADVAPLAELLALIGEADSFGNWMVIHPGPAATVHIRDLNDGPGETYLSLVAAKLADTAPLEQAIQRHKALKQYCAGWGAR